MGSETIMHLIKFLLLVQIRLQLEVMHRGWHVLISTSLSEKRNQPNYETKKRKYENHACHRFYILLSCAILALVIILAANHLL